MRIFLKKTKNSKGKDNNIKFQFSLYHRVLTFKLVLKCQAMTETTLATSVYDNGRTIELTQGVPLLPRKIKGCSST